MNRTAQICIVLILLLGPAAQAAHASEKPPQSFSGATDVVVVEVPVQVL